MTVEEARIMLQPTTLAVGPQDWCDLGCGSGLFSRALASLLPEGSRVLCMDRVEQNIDAFAVEEVTLEFQHADFTRHDFHEEKFDGFLMANSLHYVEAKNKLLSRLVESLLPNGKLIIVEYDTDKANHWVPYPIPFEEMKILLRDIGLTDVTRLSERPSVFGAKMYACEASARDLKRGRGKK